MEDELTYPTEILPRLRYQYCPMCATRLTRGALEIEDVSRIHCRACGWVHYPTQFTGVNAVVKVGDEIVAILPPDEPIGTPAALPGGHVEYGESPQEAVIREVHEETGLVVEVVRCLGWYFGAADAYTGPGVTFMFETRAVSGSLRDSKEGKTRLFSLAEFPLISPNRGGSTRTMRAYLESLVQPPE